MMLSSRARSNLVVLLMTSLMTSPVELLLSNAIEIPSRPPKTATGGRHGSLDGGHFNSTVLPPVFASHIEARHVRFRANSPAYLHCRVLGVQDWTVSWIRQKDLNILTTGLFTFTKDTRFTARHTDNTWTLKVTAPQVNDTGTYLCQVNTEPRISQTFNLTVVESRAFIGGAQELFVKTDSLIRLSCTLTHDIEQIYWLHNDSVIHYSGWTDASGERLDTPTPVEGRRKRPDNGEKWRGGKSRVTAAVERRTSHLTVSAARVSDSGLYTCQPTNAQADTVRVHVVSEENPAAMHRGGSSSLAPWCYILSMTLWLMWTTSR